MRITVDTNILISASFWLGKPKEIIELAEKKEIELVLCTGVLEEFERIMTQDKFRLKLKDMDKTAREVVKKLLTLSEVLVTTGNIKAVESDPDDDKVVECGVKGKVDYIISGDRHLLELGEYRGIRIVTASQFLNIVDVP